MSDAGFTRGLIGWADLVRVRRLGDPGLEVYLADALGYERAEPEPTAIEVELGSERTQEDAPPASLSPTTAEIARGVHFWQPTSFERFGPVEEEQSPEDREEVSPRPGRERRAVDLTFLPLSSNASLLTRLRAASPTREIRGEVDVDRIVEQWSRGRLMSELPRSTRRVWGRSVQVLVDRSRRLIPYWEDQSRACRAIREIYPAEGYSQLILPEGRFEASWMKIGRRAVGYQPPPPGSTVVALSDLGALAVREPHLVDLWAERGRRLTEQELNPVAIVPFRRSACPDVLSRHWTILPWESASDADAPALSERETRALVDQILTLLSFTLRIEPQLIRFVRRLLPAGRQEPGIEALVWQHEGFGDPSCEAAELAREWAAAYRAALSAQSAELRRQVFERVEALHRSVYEGVWFAEMGGVGRDELVEDQRDEMLRWFQEQERELATEKSQEAAALTAWHLEASERMLDVAYQDRTGLGKVLHRIWRIVHGDDPGAVPPTGADLRFLSDGPERTVELRQVGNRLVATPAGGLGSLVALIRTRQSRIQVVPCSEPEARASSGFWKDGVAPKWAEEYGWDSFGAWVDLRVGDVRQRLRWIEPGEFWMGSSEDEGGQDSDEGPRHRVRIDRGFWMFDTPCKQALWEVVLGSNPSEFKGPERPVERVTWIECQEFVKRLNERVEGLVLGLPSEEQWEYACRADSKGARYHEDLDVIAWHLGNSDRETHGVGQKVPNGCGLYDMLGNVWEWCSDPWRDNYTSRPGEAASARRVMRGGSWSSVARNVRAACRLRIGPLAKLDDLGFRCVEFRNQGPVDRGAGTRAGRIHLGVEGKDGVAFESLTPVRVISDVEQVSLGTTPCPDWASAMGRDRYGLWAEFTIEPAAAGEPRKRGRGKKKALTESPQTPVRQRLRWIPPGRFLMGSPEDEPGRYDWEQRPHEVVFDEGFWMFDTPCTQALWETIMGENPSRFRSPDRPVEQVSWDDCRAFVTKLREKIGLALSLPSEAQWEYSCRAGTTTSTYAGPLVIEGRNNASVLDAIAWYGGNSGVDFELSDGEDASDWPEKQHRFERAGTHPVARKTANSWGLYDTLGNVWEWCDDAWQESGARASAASAHRVLRGGSWGVGARRVRAACRSLVGPSFRYRNLGFRCAEFRKGREPGEQSGASEGSEAQVAEQPEIATRRAERRGRTLPS